MLEGYEIGYGDLQDRKQAMFCSTVFFILPKNAFIIVVDF